MIARVAGHFGEWIQGRIGDRGPIGLVTVPCTALVIEARRLCTGAFQLDDPARVLTAEQAAAFLAGVGGRTGYFAVSGNIPPGAGCGASTAALVALARAASGDETRLAENCVAAEGASDPLMLDAPDSVLWAPREGRALAPLPALPRAAILGGFRGAPQCTDPQDTNFPDVADLVDAVSSPLSLTELADLATESARRTTQLRGPNGDPTDGLAKDLGALGYVRAHTGSARGFVFAPGTLPKGAKSMIAEAGFSNVIRFETGGGP